MDAISVAYAAAFALVAGHPQAARDREAASLFVLARQIGPDEGSQREPPLVETAREYLAANAARLGIGRVPPVLLGITSREGVHLVRFECRRPGPPPAEAFEIVVTVRLAGGAYRVVP